MYGSNVYPVGNGLSLHKAGFHLCWKRHIINSTAGLGLKIEAFILSSGDDATVNTHGCQLPVTPTNSMNVTRRPTTLTPFP